MVASSLIVLGEQLPAPGVFQQPRVSWPEKTESVKLTVSVSS
jgi:hypothetical protein